MKVRDLSERSGVTIPTIKYYLREGLLPAGTATAANQATYGEEHLRRLRLIRALVEVGGVPVAGVRQILAAVDTPDLAGHDLLGRAHHAVSPAPRGTRDSPAWRQAREQAAAVVARQGWQVEPHAPALDALADVLAALAGLDQTDFLGSVDWYADTARHIAEHDVGVVLARGGSDRAGLVEAVVVGTVLGEAMLAALRRLAQEDASARAFSPGEPPPR